MIEGLNPYENYKEVPSRWIGRVPAHWHIRKLRTLIGARNERNRADLPLLSVARERGVFVRSLTDENHNVIPDDLTNYKVARAGNLVINKMKAWQGSMGIAPCDGIVSPAYFVYEFRIANRAFGQALLRSRPYVAHFAQASDGVRIGQWDLSIAGMREVPIVVPPADEQRAIVRFLSSATSRIDRYLQAKRTLIALLNEQKHAIIHRAVTRGIDHNAPAKDSGVAWLGHIPAHWELVALRRHWDVLDCKHLTVPFVADGIPLASVREVRSFELDLSQCKRTTETWYRLLVENGRAPRRGDLIYCRNTSVGSVAIVNSDEVIAMGQDVCLIRSADQNQRFLNYVLHSPFMSTQLELLLVGSTFKRINIADIKNLAVTVPPRPEQDSICAFLDAELAAVNAAIGCAEGEIALMREYRARLVADVVTGQLDVREAARGLPDEALEPDLTAAADDEKAEEEASEAA